jgi:hypothetical protein
VSLLARKLRESAASLEKLQEEKLAQYEACFKQRDDVRRLPIISKLANLAGEQCRRAIRLLDPDLPSSSYEVAYNLAAIFRREHNFLVESLNKGSTKSEMIGSILSVMRELYSAQSNMPVTYSADADPSLVASTIYESDLRIFNCMSDHGMMPRVKVDSRLVRMFRQLVLEDGDQPVRSKD